MGLGTPAVDVRNLLADSRIPVVDKGAGDPVGMVVGNNLAAVGCVFGGGWRKWASIQGILGTYRAVGYLSQTQWTGPGPHSKHSSRMDFLSQLHSLKFGNSLYEMVSLMKSIAEHDNTCKISSITIDGRGKPYGMNGITR